MAGLTAEQMQYEAKIAYDALAGDSAPGYTPRQWSILLTQAQERLVLQICASGLDFDELSRRAISKLIEESEFETGDNIEEYPFIASSYRVTLETNFLHIIKDTANQVKVKPVSYDFLHANTENPYEKPFDKEYWRLTGKQSVIIVTDGTPLTKYEVIYVKRPVPIITDGSVTIEEVSGVKDCELDPLVHRQIVDEAARLAHTYVSRQTLTTQERG